jgi:hypothetical protein
MNTSQSHRGNDQNESSGSYKILSIFCLYSFWLHVHTQALEYQELHEGKTIFFLVALGAEPRASHVYSQCLAQDLENDRHSVSVRNI